MISANKFKGLNRSFIKLNTKHKNHTKLIVGAECSLLVSRNIEGVSCVMYRVRWVGSLSKQNSFF